MRQANDRGDDARGRSEAVLALNRLISAVRCGFHRYGAAADVLHADLGIGAAMRAVLEAVVGGPPRTVPDIAREKRVSRQHIQVNVDALVRLGQLETRPNPAHRRSPLLVPTDAGRTAFTGIRAREKGALEEIAAGFDPAVLEAAATVLEALNDRVDSFLEKEREGDTR